MNIRLAQPVHYAILLWAVFKTRKHVIRILIQLCNFVIDIKLI